MKMEDEPGKLTQGRKKLLTGRVHNSVNMTRDILKREYFAWCENNWNKRIEIEVIACAIINFNIDLIYRSFIFKKI